MYEVVSGLLWIGHALDARNPRLLYDAKIAAVVDLALEELSVQLPRDFIYCRIPLVDGAGNDPRWLQLAVDTVVHLIAARVATVVSCSGGMSRSPAIAAAALSVIRKEPPHEVLQSIVESQPHDLSPPLWAAIMEICARLRDEDAP